jgi:hypothetical protein
MRMSNKTLHAHVQQDPLDAGSSAFESLAQLGDAGPVHVQLENGSFVVIAQRTAMVGENRQGLVVSVKVLERIANRFGAAIHLLGQLPGDFR